jgi:hypothetical protein
MMWLPPEPAGALFEELLGELDLPLVGEVNRIHARRMAHDLLAGGERQ